MQRVRRESIALQVIALIVVTVSLLLVAGGFAGYQTYRDRQWANFRQMQAVGADQFQVAAGSAAWGLDYPQIAKLMESRLGDRSVHGVVVDLDGRKLVIERDEGGEIHALDKTFDTTGLVENTRTIEYAGQPLGVVRIYASTAQVEHELLHALGVLLGLGGAIDVILSLALYFSLKRLVLDPLGQIERYAKGISIGDTAVASLRGLSFPGELEELKNSIDSMVQQLGDRNAELARSNQRFERVIRQFPSPTILFDLAGQAIYVNDRFTEIFGYRLEDLPKIETWFELTHPAPDGYRKMLAAWHKVVSAPERTDLTISTAIRPLRCKDGVLKSIETSGIVTEDGIIGVANDVTSRVQAENDLASYREQLEALVKTRTAELEKTYRRLADTEFAMNHAGIAIQWINIHTGRFIYVNQRACELYGYSQAELLNMAACIVVPDFAAERLQGLLQPMTGAGRSSIESIAHTAANRDIMIEVVLYLHSGMDDRASHCIAFTHDISQRKAAEAALQAAKEGAELAARTRSEFLANMSHEIRTPMNAIIGMSHLALKTELDSRQRNYVEKVHRAAVALLGILNDILDFSKVEARRLEIEAVEFSVEQTFENVCNVVGLRADEKGLEFLVDIAPEVPAVVVGDPMRLGQILTNLASNAIKFTERGVVRLACELAEERGSEVCLKFSVRDSGIGISAQDLPHLFNAFTQADSSISRRFGGTGLGLAICKRLVELMRGEISASSRAGEGSLFTFTLPFARAAAIPRSRELPPMVVGCRVLIVDDNAETLELLRRVVAGFGLEVDLADTASGALSRMQRQAYNVLICDWKMPGTGGVELVRMLRRNQAPHSPRTIIMVSAGAVEELRNTTADLALDGMLTKPVTPSAVYDAILSAMGQAPANSPSLPGEPQSMEYASLAGKAVLLVEDNAINQELARDFLESVGLVVTLANNGQEALDCLVRSEFSCVLMDVQMPVMDGLAATRAIRAQPRFRDLPVVAMTAGALPEEREQTRLAGMNHHLTKPIDMDLLLATVARCIGVTRASGPPPATLPVTSAAGNDAQCNEGVDLDQAAGLKLVNGNRALYNKLLTIYREQSGATLQSMQTASSSGDMDGLRRMAHTLKGTSALLGVRKVRQAASDFEAAVINVEPAEQLQPRLQAIELALQGALENIAACLDTPPG